MRNVVLQSLFYRRIFPESSRFSTKAPDFRQNFFRRVCTSAIFWYPVILPVFSRIDCTTDREYDGFPIGCSHYIFDLLYLCLHVRKPGRQSAPSAETSMDFSDSDAKYRKVTRIRLIFVVKRRINRWFASSIPVIQHEYGK